MRISALNATAHGLAVHTCCCMYIKSGPTNVGPTDLGRPRPPNSGPVTCIVLACNYPRMLIQPMSSMKHAKKPYPPNVQPRQALRVYARPTFS
jgi:hypothetical protein